MKKEDPQESRVKAVLGDDEEPVSEETVKRFCEHLKKHLEFPFEVTGIEDFEWEEFYVMGPGEKQEYERLKKTQPSHKVAMIFSKLTWRPIPSGCSSPMKTSLPLFAGSRMGGSSTLDSQSWKRRTESPTTTSFSTTTPSGSSTIAESGARL